MYRIICVSVSGYYKYCRNLVKPNKDTVFLVAIQSILDEFQYNDNYGVPRMRLELLQKEIKDGMHRITCIMREHGWLHKPHGKPKRLTHVITEI